MEFKHISVLFGESIDALNIKPNGIYADGTLGLAADIRTVFCQQTIRADLSV